VTLLFTAVMRFALGLILWPGDFLLRGICEGFEFWEHRLDFFNSLQPSSLVMQLSWYWQNLSCEWLEFVDVF